ncbi:RNA polymerase sigma factor [Candidatus Latescibacterota bacterium]
MQTRRILTDGSREREWVRRIVGGNIEAFRTLVVDYHPLAYSLAYRVLNDAEDAEEVVQDAFVKIHCALEGFRGESSLKTWILRIVLRLSLNRRRDRSRTAWRRLGLHRGGEAGDEDGELGLAAPGPDPEGLLIAKETRSRVLAAVESLSPPLREVVVLSTLEDLTYDEIARILRVPVGTVSSRLHAARRKLVDVLQREDLI